ncbi:MAG: glycosyltransferase family 8 protein [Puniceicoccales bacterium]|jgi:lipopolysaccharide biosynthesis glycosyltransferase|nr:glycosyltransferase family 8 protein [Puniceicoccales bacterium]
MREIIAIAFAFDDKFTKLFSVAAHSIAKATEANLNVYVVDCGISDVSKAKIRSLQTKCENILAVDIRSPEREEALEKLPTEERFNSSVFYRLAIPKVFPELKRVIYLDCDIVANGDISELWHENLAGRPFGAVEEDGNLSDEKTRLYKRASLLLSSDKFYYNSGVLLIDCEQFEKSKIFERVIAYVKGTEIFLSCPEQDAMNACLGQDEHMPLSPRYNFIPFASLAKKCLGKIKEPLLIEYACVKPWQMNRATVEFFHSLGICRYATTMLLNFWKAADAMGAEKFGSKNISPTLKFFCKSIFQPVEKFAKKCYESAKSSFAKHRQRD